MYVLDLSLIDVQMSACNPIINYSFAEEIHYTHCNGAKLKKDMSKSTFKILFYTKKETGKQRRNSLCFSK